MFLALNFIYVWFSLYTSWYSWRDPHFFFSSFNTDLCLSRTNLFPSSETGLKRSFYISGVHKFCPDSCEGRLI